MDDFNVMISRLGLQLVQKGRILLWLGGSGILDDPSAAAGGVLTDMGVAGISVSAVVGINENGGNFAENSFFRVCPYGKLLLS